MTDGEIITMLSNAADECTWQIAISADSNGRQRYYTQQFFLPPQFTDDAFSYSA